MGRILLGIVLGVVLLPVGILGWLRFGHAPVAVADAPLPHEKEVVGLALHARIHAELAKTVPVSVDQANLVAGARVYREQCATCHGFHGKPSTIAAHMFPNAPQLWQKHHGVDVVGVSDDPVAETYWKVANGIRLTGMPAYKEILADSEIWQVSLLLANADKPLPPEALTQLNPQAGPEAPALPVLPVGKPSNK
jgi:mono/diheme cytochrome c family protein